MAEIEFELKALAEQEKNSLTAAQPSSEPEPPPPVPSACTPHLTSSSLERNMDKLQRAEACFRKEMCKLMCTLEQKESQIQSLKQQLTTITEVFKQTIPSPSQLAIPSPRELAIPSPRELAIPSPRELAIPSPRELAIPSPSQLATPLINQPTIQLTNSPQHQETLALLIDNNGKFLNHKKLFPAHNVIMFRCSTTDIVLERLSQFTEHDLQYIVIHTGTNEIYSKGDKVADSVKTMAQKVHKRFPKANITISTLLPRNDYPLSLINKINENIIKKCSNIPNTLIAQHPTITSNNLHDDIHLHHNFIRIFAKNLKDAALRRDPNNQKPIRATELQGPPANYHTPQHPPRQKGHKPHNTHHGKARAMVNKSQSNKSHPSKAQPAKTKSRCAQGQDPVLNTAESKALRERWLLDGAPSSGENEFQRQLQEDEAKTRELEQSIPRLEQEIEELETGVPVSKSAADKQNLINTTDGPGKVENGVPKTRQVTGIEAKLECTNLDAKAIENASADHPVTMVFMGYKNVENEDETKKVLGIEDAVKAELVVIEDSENKAATEDGKNEEKAPLNGAPSSPDDKKQDEATNGDEAKQGEAKKEKQRCKCCTVM